MRSSSSLTPTARARRSRGRVARASLVFGLLSISIVARAQSAAPDAAKARPALAVLELSSDGLHGAFARDLSARLRGEVQGLGRYELRDTPVSLEQLSLAQDCDASDLNCLSRIAAKLEVDGFVYGSVQSQSGAQIVRLRYYDRAQGAQHGSAIATLAAGDLDSAALDQKVHELIAELLGDAPASSPFDRDAPHVAHTTLGATSANQVSEHPLSARKVTGYALLGGAVLSAGMSVLSFVEIDRAQNNDAFDRYRRNVGQERPNARDVCDQASAGQSFGLDAGSFQKVKSSCSTGRTFEVLQFVFLAGAVFSSGVSAYLLLGGTPESRQLGTFSAKNIMLRPTFNKHGASLDARLRF